jgi:hypothetical protein
LRDVGCLEDRLRAAGGAQDDVGALELLPDPLEGDRLAAEAAGELLGALDPMVRDEHSLGAAREEARRGELPHLPRADHEHAAALERPDDTLGELGGSRGHSRSHGADARLGAYALPGMERVLAEPVQHAPGRPGLARELVRLAYLSEDLRLAGEERFEAGGDAEEMGRGVAGTPLVDDLGELARAEPRPRSERRPGGVRGGVVGREVDLGPVAGREDERLVAVPSEPVGERGGVGRREVEALAYVEAGPPVRRADHEERGWGSAVRAHEAEPTSGAAIRSVLP